MNVGRAVKESMVEELQAHLAERPNVFVTTVNRLPAAEADQLRKKLHASSARMVMVKRRLGKRTMEHLNIAELAKQLEGSIGLIFVGDDVVPPAKLLVDFQKAHEQQVSVRAAMIEGQFLDQARVTQLAQLPPRPVLLAEVLGTIEAPLSSLIFTIEQLIGDIAWNLEQLAAKKPAEPTQADTVKDISAATGLGLEEAKQRAEQEGESGAAPSTAPATPPPTTPGASGEQKPPQQEGPGTPEKA